ncbi:helix-turn-helix transcriptional regulator [Leucobacter weissii]|uniref:Helix-turn-helix transcriptional regulator n=1 Tax=Leucobacter weissii TaxID=1983706 RepID=A0A939S6Z1_9MICO|nr:XRE family transcriptional regulator [Leucobacter weissii]MBO1900401.1 helix-turn-helix transcriptional regulator [Leucobacter weissii]
MAISSVIARNTKRFREDRGYSQAVLAGRAGLSKQTIIALEGGRSNPTIETLEVLAEALGVSARALISEMGNEVLLQSGELVHWQEQGGLAVRNLDQVYGSGYVYNAVIRLEARTGVVRPRAGTRGMLRHCYLIEGRAELGPEGRTVEADEGDFVRFPGEAPHLFRSITSSALIFVVTTMPQQSMRNLTNTF